MACFGEGSVRIREWVSHGWGGGREEQLQKKSQTGDLGYRDGEEIYIFCTPEFMVRDLYETYLWHTKGLKDSKQH